MELTRVAAQLGWISVPSWGRWEIKMSEMTFEGGFELGTYHAALDERALIPRVDDVVGLGEGQVSVDDEPLDREEFASFKKTKP